MGQRERVELALTALREAQLDASLWPSASALIDDACGLVGNHLVIVSGDRPDNFRKLFSKLYHRGESNEDLELLYMTEYQAIDERLPRLHQLPHGKLVPVTELYSEQELRHSPTYNDYFVSNGAGNSLNVRMDGLRGLNVVMVLVSMDYRADWTNQQFQTIQVLLPHIQHFANVRQALSDTGTSAVRTAADALGAKRIGILLLDRRGWIVEANDHARRLLRDGVGLADVGGQADNRLIARHVDDNRTLSNLLSSALATSAVDAQGGFMSVRRPSASPLTLYVSPFGSSDNPNIGSLNEIAAMVLIVDPQDKPEVDANRLEIALGLTYAQARIAASLASGATVQSIAASTNRSEATVRWHLKQMMQRLGISSQTDLVRLVITTPGVFSN